MFQYVCPYGTNGFLFRSFLRKFAQLDFRHMNVAKEKTHTAKKLQKNAKKKGTLIKNHWVLATVQLAKGGKERKTTIQYLLFALHGLKNMLVQTSAPGVRHFRIQNRSGGTGTDGRWGDCGGGQCESICMRQCWARQRNKRRRCELAVPTERGSKHQQIQMLNLWRSKQEQQTCPPTRQATVLE